jgi:hypothetical protein
MFESAVTKDEYERERSKEGLGEKAHQVVAAHQNNCALFIDQTLACEDPSIAVPGGNVLSSLVFPVRGQRTGRLSP